MGDLSPTPKYTIFDDRIECISCSKAPYLVELGDLGGGRYKIRLSCECGTVEQSGEAWQGSAFGRLIDAYMR
jgi:hypothetical protein